MIMSFYTRSQSITAKIYQEDAAFMARWARRYAEQGRAAAAIAAQRRSAKAYETARRILNVI